MTVTVGGSHTWFRQIDCFNCCVNRLPKTSLTCTERKRDKEKETFILFPFGQMIIYVP